jgi:uncharacterized protein
MLRVSSFLLIVLATLAAFGQQGAADAAAKKRSEAKAKTAAQALPADAPTREQVMRLFGIMQLDKTMDGAVRAAKEQSMEMAEQMASERIPNATPDQKKQLHDMTNEVMNQALGPATINEMLEATIPVYQRHLSKADLDAMVAFYSSPVGQKILREQPAMVQESMQAASGIQQRIARSMYQKIDQRIEQIAHSTPETKKP